MNWPRIGRGGALAALALLVYDMGVMVLSQRIFVSEPNLAWAELGPIALSLILPNLVTGFLLCWMYVLARPRLGPGPKTAILTGTIGFAFANPHYFGVTVFLVSGLGAFLQIGAVWLKFALATYLAGWQYLEKAP